MKTSQELILNSLSRIKSALSSLEYIIGKSESSLSWLEIYQCSRVLLASKESAEKLIIELNNPLRELALKINTELGIMVDVSAIFNATIPLSVQFQEACALFFNTNKANIYQKREINDTDFIIEETQFLPETYQNIIDLAILIRDQLSILA